MSKVCFKCKKEKDNVDFYFNIKNSDGLCSYCKECTYFSSKNWKQNHQEQAKNTGKLRRIKNYEKIRKYEKESNLKIKNIFATIKHNSKRKNMVFILTLEEFTNWYEGQKQECFYCKRSLKECLKDDSAIKRLTIDRIDNNLEYSLTNMVLACWPCNELKWDLFTKEDMQIIGPILAKRYREKNSKRSKNVK
jgi:5-methylcytosine-specific restriction endonuclease McrA